MKYSYAIVGVLTNNLLFAFYLLVNKNIEQNNLARFNGLIKI